MCEHEYLAVKAETRPNGFAWVTEQCNKCGTVAMRAKRKEDIKWHLTTGRNRQIGWDASIGS